MGKTGKMSAKRLEQKLARRTDDTAHRDKYAGSGDSRRFAAENRVNDRHRRAQEKRDAAEARAEAARQLADEAEPTPYNPVAGVDRGHSARDRTYRDPDGENEAKHVRKQREADQESEQVMESLPGATIDERLDSASRGLVYDKPKRKQRKPKPKRDPEDPRFKPKVYRCGCGFTGTPEKIQRHQQRERFAGVHLLRRDVTAEDG